MAELFWATLTTEYYYRRAFTTRDQVYTGVATWIEDFYNRRRIHTSLGGKSPSNTNDTKRPGQQPHKQTVNNLRTTPPSTRTPAKRAGSSDAACRHGLIWDHTVFHVVASCRANPAMVAPSKRNCRIAQRIARTPKRARGAHTE